MAFASTNAQKTNAMTKVPMGFGMAFVGMRNRERAKFRNARPCGLGGL